MAEALHMTFRSNAMLWLLAALPVVLALLVTAEQRRRRLSGRFVSDRVRWTDNGIRGIRPLTVVVGLGASVLALAGPQLGFQLIPVEEREANRVFVVDVSESMDAEDVGTSRLEAAKAVARTLIAAQNGRVALVVFEGEPQVVSPLTTDGDAVATLLDSTQTGEISQPGTDLGAALSAAEKIAGAEMGQKSDIVVISDGEEQGKHLDAALDRARSRGITISTVMIGTPEGATIPVGGHQQALRDTDGQVVTTRAHPEVLQRVAQTTGGHFIRNPRGAAPLASLMSGGSGRRTGRQKLVRIPVDRFQWPLALGIAALLIGSISNRGAE
jgi:Ca-activated chloride channel family protein